MAWSELHLLFLSPIGLTIWLYSNDNLNRIPSNVSSVVDLLDAKGISWGAYQEDLPYTGFEGNAWTNQQTGANDYVRKHNPPIIYDSVATNVTRRSQVKSLTSFQDDLAANKLPQCK